MPIKVQGCEVVTNDRKLINLDGAGVSGIVTSLVAGTGINISGATGQVTISGTVAEADTFWVKNTTGIHTTSNVGIGTTNVSSKLYLENGALTVSNTGAGTSNLYSSSLNNKTLSLLSHNSEFGDAKSPVIKIGRSHLLDDIKYSEREITYTDLSPSGFVLINDVAVYNRWWAAVNYQSGVYFGSGWGPIGISSYVSNLYYESVAIGLTGGNTYRSENDIVYVVGAPSASTYGQVELWKRIENSILGVFKYSTITRPSGADSFGYSVAIDNGIIAIGAPTGGTFLYGEVYLYDTNGTFIRKIEPIFGTASSNDQFGYSVAIKNNKVVIGSPFTGSSNIGKVYVYNIDGSDGFIISPSDGQTNDYFGYSVAISDQFIVVGAPYADPLATASGAVYVYNLDGTGERKIVPSTGGSLDLFGHSVRIDSNNNLFVGAPGYGNDEGAVFRYNLIGPIKEDIITPSTNYSSGDEFGYAIDVDDSNNLVAGSYDSSLGQGHLYFYNIGNTLEMEYLSERPPAALDSPLNFPQFKVSSTTYDSALSANWAEKANIINISGESISIGNKTPPLSIYSFTAIGSRAGYSITTGTNNSENVFIGARAGINHISGRQNTYVGVSANSFETNVEESTVVGWAGLAQTTGVSLGISPYSGVGGISIGYFAGSKQPRSISIGYNAGYGCNRSANNGCDNISIGYSAGCRISDGCSNIFIGCNSGIANTCGSNNIFMGSQAGFTNTGGSDNIFIGPSSGYSNTSANENVFVGKGAGFCNNVGLGNLLLGAGSGYFNENGNYNSFVGPGAGRVNTSGICNVALGIAAGGGNNGDFNTYLGPAAGYRITQQLNGCYNIHIGYNAGSGYAHNGSDNIFIGNNAGCSISGNASDNIFMGRSAGIANSTGSYNIILGSTSGVFNVSGESNTIIGSSAGYCNTIGSRNVFIGQQAGLANTCGFNNVFIGCQAGYNNTSASNNIAIGRHAGSTGASPSGLINLTTTGNNIVIGNVAITNFYTKMAATGSGGNAVCWNGTTYELYSASSSARYKENIRPFLSGVKELVDIEPVTFTYIDRPDEPEQIGFIAEQLDEIGLTHFVNYDKDNMPDSVSYDRVIVLAINAIKELNNENQELKLRITQLENVVGISSSGSN